MADGKTHDRIGLAFVPVAAFASQAIAQSAQRPELFWIGTIAYTLGITHLSPDLDLKSNPYRRWLLLKWIWLPYQKLCPHRGFSHDILIGTLSRVLYLALPVGIVLNAAGETIELTSYSEAIAVALVALEFSAWVHLALDGILIKRLLGARR